LELAVARPAGVPEEATGVAVARGDAAVRLLVAAVVGVRRNPRAPLEE
jgi:hypothetical protein